MPYITSMDKAGILQFLADLSANNSKEYMDAHRARYTAARDLWLREIGLILARLARHDAFFSRVEPKETITRINNNRRFHPDKPLYKDTFTTTPLGGMDRPAFHISVSPSGSFIAAGLYRPGPEALKKVREAIDYQGETLKDILAESSFHRMFGGLSDDEGLLRTMPRGYDRGHPHADLLRRRNFIAMMPLSPERFCSPDFPELAEQAYLAARPLIEWLQQALDFEE